MLKSYLHMMPCGLKAQKSEDGFFQALYKPCTLALALIASSGFSTRIDGNGTTNPQFHSQLVRSQLVPCFATSSLFNQKKIK